MSLECTVADFVQFHNNIGFQKRVAVYGDLMLDLYDSVRVNRLSPEFPIPVLDCQGDDNYIVRPGGAGNVCHQFRHFNAAVHLFAFKNGHANFHLKEEYTFDIDTCLQCHCHVPLKRRYYDGDFPLCRMDHEKKNYGLWKPEEQRDQLFKKFTEFAQKKPFDVAILSDYNKGVFDPDVAARLVWWCRDQGIKTIVDPKRDIFQWQHCTVFKPNLAEAANFLRVDAGYVLKNWRDCVRELQEKTLAESVVITNGGNGVFGIDQQETFEYRPENPAEDVRSVIGAGDCFAAVLALAVAHGYRVADAVEIACEAGAVYVQKKHNEPIWPHELLARVEPSYAKILAPEQALQVCREHKGKKTIIFTNGCFDILHRGHVSTLEFAKKQGDILIVALNTDESVKRLKGESRPINDLYSRRIMVAAMGCVDFVTYFDEDTPAELIEALKPDIVVKGGDYKPEEVVGHQTCKVVLAPVQDCHSTTSLIERMRLCGVADFRKKT